MLIKVHENLHDFETGVLTQFFVTTESQMYHDCLFFRHSQSAHVALTCFIWSGVQGKPGGGGVSLNPGVFKILKRNVLSTDRFMFLGERVKTFKYKLYLSLFVTEFDGNYEKTVISLTCNFLF